MRPHVICHMVASLDGRQGAPSLFDGGASDPAAPIGALRLEHSEVLDGGAIWLRYRLDATA